MESLGFYEVAAQLIPLLFLGLVVEVRVFSQLKERRLPTLMLAAIGLSACVAGEVAACRVLIDRAEAEDSQFRVVAALCFAGGAIVLPIFGPLAAELWKRSRWIAVPLLLIAAFSIFSAAYR